MCGGVEVAGRYTQTGQQLRIYFPNPRAALPVRQADGAVAWVPWGRRQMGALPPAASAGAGRTLYGEECSRCLALV